MSTLSSHHFVRQLCLFGQNLENVTNAISSGRVALPELPVERSPAYCAYCIMLSVVSVVISALCWQKHSFDAEASASG